jgi:Fic family protein
VPKHDHPQAADGLAAPIAQTTANIGRAMPGPDGPPPPDPAGERPIAIVLSRSQVDQIFRAASQSAGAGSLFTGLHESSTIDISAVARASSRVSASLLTGLAVLGVLPRDGSELSNVQIARALNIGVSTAHRYLVTLLAVGLVQRDPNTRRYSVPQ